jgi:hypothetical protein
MRRVAFIGLAFLALLGLACQQGGDESGVVTENLEEPVEASAPPFVPAPDIRQPPDPVPSPPLDRGERRVIRNAALSLIVSDPPSAAERLVRLADSLDGYTSDLAANRREELLYYRIVLRIPASRLDQALAAIKALAVRVEREEFSAEDVTRRYVDLDARLRTLVATETELQALLAESRSRGSSAEEIMAIFRELTEIRTRIEQTQGELELLESQVALSTITVELSPEAGSGPIVGERWRPGATVREAVRTLLTALRVLADLLIYAAVVLVPILAVLAVPVLILFYLLRRALRRKRAVGP